MSKQSTRRSELANRQRRATHAARRANEHSHPPRAHGVGKLNQKVAKAQAVLRGAQRLAQAVQP